MFAYNLKSVIYEFVNVIGFESLSPSGDLMFMYLLEAFHFLYFVLNSCYGQCKSVHLYDTRYIDTERYLWPFMHVDWPNIFNNRDL